MPYERSKARVGTSRTKNAMMPRPCIAGLKSAVCQLLTVHERVGENPEPGVGRGARYVNGIPVQGNCEVDRRGPARKYVRPCILPRGMGDVLGDLLKVLLS